MTGARHPECLRTQVRRERGRDLSELGQCSLQVLYDLRGNHGRHFSLSSLRDTFLAPVYPRVIDELVAAGAMNGLEFARRTTAGGFDRVLIHAAPGKAKVEVIADDDRVVACAGLDRSWKYSPMTLIDFDGSTLRRREVWPTDDLYGLSVLLAAEKSGSCRRGITRRITAGGGGRSSFPTTPAALTIGLHLGKTIRNLDRAVPSSSARH